MAKYTITLREIVKQGYDVFDNTWSTFDPKHKEELCSKILRHYWFYEIGQETADRFKFYLNEQLAMIMPYYNKLYASELLKIEPLYNMYMENDSTSQYDSHTTRGISTRSDINALKQMADSIRKNTKGLSNTIANEGYKGHESWQEDRNIHTTEITDRDTTDDTTENMTEKVDYTENMTQDENEKMTDQFNGSKITDGTSNTTTSNTRKYSDTPQGRISSSGIAIEQNYLTNYTADSGNEHVTSHADEKTSNTEDRNTDTTTTRDTTSTQNTTMNDTKNETGTMDQTVTTDTTDNVVGSKDKTHTIDNTKDITTTGEEKGFSNGSEQNTQTNIGYTGENTQEKEKEGKTSKTKGFTVSQSDLLIAFRNTFINIDEMIIKDLAKCFMGIF